MREEREHREVEADVSVGRVRLEHGHQTDEGEREQKGVLPQSDGERDDVDEHVELEGGDEEEAEVLEHLSEKVPEESHVGRQLGHGQDEAVGGGEEARVGAHEVVRGEKKQPKKDANIATVGAACLAADFQALFGSFLDGFSNLDEDKAMSLEIRMRPDPDHKGNPHLNSVPGAVVKGDAKWNDEHNWVETLIGGKGEHGARRGPPAADHAEEEEGEPAVGHDRRRPGRARRHDVGVEQVGQLDVAGHATRLLLPY